MYRIVPIVILLILAGMVACSATLPRAAAPVGAAAAAPHRIVRPAPSGPPRYDANALYADLMASKAQAPEKYRHAPFLVVGWLQKIRAIGTTEIQMDLRTAGSQPVRVRLKADDDCGAGSACGRKPVALSSLPHGFQITLRCEQADLTDGVPTVAGCVLTPPDAG